MLGLGLRNAVVRESAFVRETRSGAVDFFFLACPPPLPRESYLVTVAFISPSLSADDGGKWDLGHLEVAPTHKKVH